MNKVFSPKTENMEDRPALVGRIEAVLKILSAGMLEREEVIAVAFLGALSGQNSFLYGPPGTAKSLIARRISSAFNEPAYFEYLMNRFSTPEEIFGPVSIKDLKEDKYTRKTDHYLPTADFAFLDEIWKSSPAILNTLLTLVNERIFRNGTTIEDVPLKALIAASNETPEPAQGLDALFDRFVIRLLVAPIEQTDNFEHLLDQAPTEPFVALDQALLISTDEWVQWRASFNQVRLSKDTKRIIALIREELAQRYEKLGVYVSDRRWQRAATLMKASAFFNDRNETNHSDAALLQHCLWTHADNRKKVIKIVTKAIEKSGFDSGYSHLELDNRKDSLDKEIKEELYHRTDVYKTKTLNGQEYFEVQPYSINENNRILGSVYIPFKEQGSNDRFHPVDALGNIEHNITCNFDGQGACDIDYDWNYGGGHRIGPSRFSPEILFHKGDKKDNVNSRLIDDLKKSVVELRKEIEAALGNVQAQFEGYEATLDSPFVSKATSQIALRGIKAQMDSLKLRIADCERLEALCS